MNRVCTLVSIGFFLSSAVALTPSVSASDLLGSPVMISGGAKLQCRRTNRVEWKKFDFEKKIVWLVVKDKLNRVTASAQVSPTKTSAAIFIPEFFERTAKLVIADDKNTALFESGAEISIDCDKMRSGDGDGSWNDGDWNDGN